jgi:hypothetical protein
LPIGVLGKADTAGLGIALQACGDVDAVAHQVAIGLLDHVAEMNTNAEFDAVLGCQACIAHRHSVLHFNRAAHGFNDAPKLD